MDKDTRSWVSDILPTSRDHSGNMMALKGSRDGWRCERAVRPAHSCGHRRVHYNRASGSLKAAKLDTTVGRGKKEAGAVGEKTLNRCGWTGHIDLRVSLDLALIGAHPRTRIRITNTMAISI